jgi:predicted DNA-binding transcriptional regulator AlpA
MRTKLFVMTMSRDAHVPFAENQPLLDLWPVAGQIFGMSRATTYTLATAGTFPVEVLRIGGRLKVRTIDIRRYLGLDA